MSRTSTAAWLGCLLSLSSGCTYIPSCDEDAFEADIEATHPVLGESGVDVLARLSGDHTAQLWHHDDHAGDPSELRVSVVGLQGDVSWWDQKRTEEKWFHMSSVDLGVMCGLGMDVPVAFVMEHPETGTVLQGEGALRVNALEQARNPGRTVLVAELPLSALQTDLDWQAELPVDQGVPAEERFEFDGVLLYVIFEQGEIVWSSVEVTYAFRRNERGGRIPRSDGRALVWRLMVPASGGDTGGHTFGTGSMGPGEDTGAALR